MDIIKKYFTDLSDRQIDQLSQLGSLYEDWNSKINVISRKDIDQLYERHILHSLAVAKYINLKPNTKILDVGCGGGLPGIPLAIMYPEVDFHLVDSVRKKLTVVNDICEQLEIKNIKTSHSRMEEIKGQADFVISRAVARLSKLLGWTKHLVSENHKNPIPNGWICLKGGDLSEEKKEVKSGYSYVEQTPISNYFEEEYYREKHIIYVQR